MNTTRRHVTMPMAAGQLLALVLLIVVSLNSVTAMEDLPTAIGKVRKDTKTAATNASNLNERLVILFQWQRLLFEKGNDVGRAITKERAMKIEETARDNPTKAYKMVDKAYSDLEQQFGKVDLSADHGPRPPLSDRPEQGINSPPSIPPSTPQMDSQMDAQMDTQSIKQAAAEIKSSPSNEQNVRQRAALLNSLALTLRQTHPDSQKIYTSETAILIKAYLNEDPKKAAAIVDRIIGDLDKLESGVKAVTPKVEIIKKTVELPISGQFDKVKITEGIPASQSGREVVNSSSAFKSYSSDVKNGVVEVALADAPLYIEPLSEAQCAPNAAESPFVLISPEVDVLLQRQSEKYAGKYANELNLKWIRFLGATGLNYMVYKSGGKDLSSGTSYLNQLKTLYDDAVSKGLTVITTIHPGVAASAPNPQAGGLGRLTFTERDVKDYTEFLKAAITKLPKVKYFFVETEADYKFDAKDYALVLSTTYKTIKASCLDCKIITAGYVNPERSYYKEVLDNLVIMKTPRAFDIFDMWHPFGSLNVYKGADTESEKIKVEFDKSARLLKSYGYSDVPIWIGETSYPSASHNPYETIYSERRQAADLIGRYLSAMAAGVKKVVWTNIYDHHKFAGDFSYYDNTGFIPNPKNNSAAGGASFKKLSFYTYRMLADKINCLDSPSITRLQLREMGVDGYKLAGKNGQTLYVILPAPSASNQATR